MELPKSLHATTCLAYSSPTGLVQDCKLKTGAIFKWSHEHFRMFLYVSATQPQYYNQEKPLTCTFQVDALKRGLGAALLQEVRPVAHGSKSLSEAETRRYSNRETMHSTSIWTWALALQCIYHKPLVSMVQKQLPNVPPRLARILLRIQWHDLIRSQLRTKKRHFPGWCTSRVTPCTEGEIRGLDISIHKIHSQWHSNTYNHSDQGRNCNSEIVQRYWFFVRLCKIFNLLLRMRKR